MSSSAVQQSISVVLVADTTASKPVVRAVASSQHRRVGPGG